MAGFGKKISQQLKQMILWSLALIALISAQPFLWRYVSAQAHDLQDRRTQEQQFYNLEARLAEVRQTNNDQQQLLDQLSVVFLPRGETSQVVERLEQLAERHGVVLQILGITERPVEDTKDRSGIVPVVVTLEGSGLPDQLFSYLDAVEHTQEASLVNSWSVQEVRNNPGSIPAIVHRLQMSVTFYFQSPQE